MAERKAEKGCRKGGNDDLCKLMQWLFWDYLVGRLLKNFVNEKREGLLVVLRLYLDSGPRVISADDFIKGTTSYIMNGIEHKYFAVLWGTQEFANANFVRIVTYQLTNKNSDLTVLYWKYECFMIGLVVNLPCNLTLMELHLIPLTLN